MNDRVDPDELDPDDDIEPDDDEPDDDEPDDDRSDDDEPDDDRSDDDEPDDDRSDDDEPDDDRSDDDEPDDDRSDDDDEPDDIDDNEPDDIDRHADDGDGGVTGDPLVAAGTAGGAPPVRHARDDGSLGSGDEPSRTRRVSRWDRPRPPHDWRYFVGVLGRTLIVTGLLMFGFVGYQLWGTGLETARAQDRLGDEFDELVAAARPDVTAPPTTATAATTTTTASTPASTPASAVTTTSPDADSSGDSTDGETPTTTVAPVEQDIPEILPGKALAKLEIPRMGKEGSDALLVVPGVDLDSLQQGPGHYPDTPLPGQLGNAAIAGHRTTWGEPFARIDELVPGDEIIVTMLTGDRFVYEVASTEIVSPDDYYVVQTTDSTVAELTLTSCHPRWSARQRIAVHAFLQPEESAPVGEPTYYDLEANDGDRDGGFDAGASGDDPTITLPDDTATAADDTGDTAGDSSGDPEVVVVPGPDGPDALTAGWFHDSEAWPQIILWGAVCAAIAVLAYRISRRFRNVAIGWSIAVAPFVVALYFLYQNVNRLLPPGL